MPTPEAEVARTPGDPLGIAGHLDMKRHAVAAGCPNALEMALGLRNHEVAVEHPPSLVDEPGDGAQHDGADRDLVDEVTVADVEVKDPRASVEQAAELLAQAGEVRGVDRGLDDARTCPLSPSHRLTVLPVGHDDEKRLAAEAAAELVEDGMAVGLGTGSTVAYFLPALAARELDIRCVATSLETEQDGA